MRTLPKWIPPVVVLALSCAAFTLMVKLRRTERPQPPAREDPKVACRTLEREDFSLTIRSQGTVEAAITLRLVAEVDGRTTQVSPSLKKGGFFSKGDLLLSIDERDYQLAVTRASAQVASAQLRLAMVEAEARVAEEDWEALGREGKASALLLRQPQLVEARATLAAADADLAKAQLDLERTRMVAPFSGRVRSANVDRGQFVRRGEALATVFSIERVEVSVPLPLSEFEFLNLPLERSPEAFARQPVGVTLIGRFGRREHRWQGQVVRVGGEVDIDSRMASVVVAIEDPYRSDESMASPPLRVGTFVTAEIEGRKAKGVYVLTRTELWDEGKALAIDSENRLRKRNLEVLWSDRHRVVVQHGFEPGDRLCVSAIDIPQDGMVVGPVAVGSETEWE